MKKDEILNKLAENKYFDEKLIQDAKNGNTKSLDAIIRIGNSSVYGVCAEKDNTIRELCDKLSKQKNETISI
jgi:hypothetical protein